MFCLRQSNIGDFFTICSEAIRSKDRKFSRILQPIEHILLIFINTDKPLYTIDGFAVTPQHHNGVFSAMVFITGFYFSFTHVTIKPYARRFNVLGISLS